MQDHKKAGELTETELRELIPELQSLTERYKRAEKVQKALFDISELASSVGNLDRLYKAVHDIIGDFMNADNFFVAFYDEEKRNVDFVYFIDEIDQEESAVIPFEKIMDGITGYILKSGNSLFITKENIDQTLHDNKISLIGTKPIDLVGLPLMRSSQVIGAMVVQSYTDEVRYNSDDFEVLSFISQHIVTTVDRVKNRELTERTIRERTKQLRQINNDLQEEISERQRIESLQKALFEISELSASIDENMEKFYAKLHATLARLLSAPNCYIAILDSTRENLQFPYFSDEHEESPIQRPLGLGLSEFVIRQGEASLIDKSRIPELAEAGEIDVSLAQDLLRVSNSWLGSPLVINNAVQGVIAVQTYGMQEDYTHNDLEILRFVSNHIAVAMERRKTADALKRYNQELAEKVNERTEELNATNVFLKKQIDERKEIELKLIHDAHHDALTDLPNRVMFNSRLELAIANKKRYPENHFAVLFIDLDRFKVINDTLGHHAGDQFLIEVAARIDQCKRGHDLLARLGGDEFVLLLDNFDEVNDVEEVASRVITSVAAPFTLDGREMYSGASIGITHIDAAYNTADEVLRDADAAMYQAKKLGRGRFVSFDLSMREQLLENIELETEFRAALKSNDFECILQPVSRLEDKQPIYYECSVQWRHSSLGQISREQFWELAEQCSLTLDLNQLAIKDACKLLTIWHNSDNIEYKHARLGVSLSVEHLLQRSLVNKLIEYIEKCDFPPEKLFLEFSESALANRSQLIMPAVKKIKRSGVGLVLDNFGSGTASLNYLFSYPFDFVKLAKRFTHSLQRSEKGLKFVESLVLIADKTKVDVIAEGIDTHSRLNNLINLGCKYGQGSILGEAKNASDFYS